MLWAACCGQPQGGGSGSLKVHLLLVAAAPAPCALSSIAGRPARPTCPLSCPLSCYRIVARLQVKVRYVPKTLGGPSYFGSFSGYPVKAILPDSFMMRRSNKGLENVAVSPDGKTAWTMMQVGGLGGWVGGWAGG